MVNLLNLRCREVNGTPKPESIFAEPVDVSNGDDGLAESEDSLVSRLAALREEMNIEQESLLLGEESRHLQALKEDLEELRRGIEVSLPSYLHSGGSTPAATTPMRVSSKGSIPPVGTGSLRVMTPSPMHLSAPLHRSRTNDNLVPISVSTSGNATPLSPASPSALLKLGTMFRSTS